MPNVTKVFGGRGRAKLLVTYMKPLVRKRGTQGGF